MYIPNSFINKRAPAKARALIVYSHKRLTMCKGYYPYAPIVYAMLLLLSMGFVKKFFTFL